MESPRSSAMNLLPSSTVRLIASSQVITSVSSVVKELIENSLDAGATSIEIKLLIKQYYNKQTAVSSNRYPVAFLSVNIPPEVLDVNLEPNKTSVMLTNKDELMTILTNLLEEFYSDEKNKLPLSKGTDCNSTTEKSIAVIGKLGDITNTCGLNGEVATHASSNLGEKSKEKERSLHLDKSIVPEDTPSLEHEVEETYNEQVNTRSDKNNTQENTLSNKNDLQTEREKSSHHEGISPTNQTDKLPSSVVAQKATINQAVSLPSSQQEDTCMLSPTDSLQSVELCETFSDKTLCEVSESTCNMENNVCSSSIEPSSVAENGNSETGHSVSNLNNEKSNRLNKLPVTKTANTGNSSNATDTDGKPKGSQELSKNRTLVCNPSNSPSLGNSFSLDLDDLFEDSDLDLISIDSNLKTPGTSNHVRNLEKDASVEMPSSATEEETASVTKPSTTVTVSSGTTKAQCSDKEWSMGRGIVDKQGNPVQPVTLVTPGPPRQISVNRTPVFSTPLHGKRKLSSDQDKSRLSLSSKKIKKIPEITNQPLINKVMSPNPLQRKLLYKKTEIPFSLTDVKESVKRKTDPRSIEDSNSDHLIGRLDPWGVWLLRRGTDLVCVNQYRIQEQLLFQRLMACHSLPKEGLKHPITLNERIVGGPDCWRTLCNMSSKCDPPDTTRWIDDERLTSNGFDVCLKTDAESGETKVELYQMSTSIPFYGVPDLAEVLELACQKDTSDSNSLSSCRPFKVVHYLQGEAVRVARTLSSRMNRTEVDELLSRMEEQISEDAKTCVHGRPFFEKIAKIPQE
ncbi:uncharacterized protein LOC144659619 isoform X2 [Oculina patagonica]